jgi:hypothetical protein
MDFGQSAFKPLSAAIGQVENQQFDEPVAH